MGKKTEYAYCGLFTEQWRSPPPPFNPEFDPRARGRFERVTASMEADGFYSGHTREECREEWRKRYEELEVLDNGI
jgi:hypothetical protein